MAYLPGSALPPAASDRVEFISQIHANPSTELAPTGARGMDVSYLRRYVRALEDAGFDYMRGALQADHLGHFGGQFAAAGRV
jgi:hypothetical protein